MTYVVSCYPRQLMLAKCTWLAINGGGMCSIFVRLSIAAEN
jgi:hypothetical protein